MIEIIPGILEKEWAEIEKKIELVKPFAKAIHIDLLDGKFADNTTFADPTPFAKYTNDITFELHMMVEDPIQYIKPWAAVGFRRFIGHIEKMPDQVAFVAKAQQYGEVGLAVDGPSEADTIKVPWEDLDTMLLMTIKAGFSGLKFEPEELEKVKLFRERTLLPLAVDGGVHIDTIRQAFDAGATRFIVTSALFNEPDIRKAYEDLRAQLPY